MRHAKLFLGSVITMMLLPTVGLAGEFFTWGPFACPKVEETVFITPPNACYVLKAGCKGASEYADVYVQRDGVIFRAYTDSDPDCRIQSGDVSQLQKSLKGQCESDDSSIKLELKRDDNLCGPCCAPSVDGSCDGVCVP